ncbi:cytokine receptor common subunit gamma-like [Aulostomus maculatus]
MKFTLLLLLFLVGHVFATEPPDINCIVLHLKTVQCTWDRRGSPAVNYTFHSWFHHQEPRECEDYLSENGIDIGCNRPYGDRLNRFYTFYTKLVHGNDSFLMEKCLKNKVKLNPPANLTVQNETDSKLWFYWNQTIPNCVESEVRYRVNDRVWKTEKVSAAEQSFPINWPSSSSKYELQVRSKIGNSCGESLFWSDWSDPVVWGSNNSTDPNVPKGSMSEWTPVLYVFGTITLILLVMMLLHHERLRIIFIPAVPKPSLIPQDVEGWLQISKSLKEGFETSYNERACPVREYSHYSDYDSSTSDSSTSSFTTDQTDCSISIPSDKSGDLSTPCSSSSSTVVMSSE